MNMTAKAICGIMTQTGVDPVNLVKQVVDYVTIFCLPNSFTVYCLGEYT